MTEIKPYMCSCCNEIWSRENQKSIKLGKYELHLCPDCYHEYIISNNAVLDKIRAEIETNITILKEKTMQKMTKIMTEIPTEAFANIKEGYLCQEDTDDVIKSITQNATTLDAYLNNIRSEIEAELGTNDYKNEGIYAALHVMDKHIVECGK